MPKNGRAAFQNVDKHVQPVTRPILRIPGVYSRDEGRERERESERRRERENGGRRVEIKKSDTDCTLSINRIDFPLRIQRARARARSLPAQREQRPAQRNGLFADNRCHPAFARKITFHPTLRRNTRVASREAF